MARITVEDCIDKFPSRFELVLVASQRARKLHSGDEPTVEKDNDKNTVIALREIADTTITVEDMKENLIQEYQTVTISDEEEENLELESLDSEENDNNGEAVPEKPTDKEVEDEMKELVSSDLINSIVSLLKNVLYINNFNCPQCIVQSPLSLFLFFCCLFLRALFDSYAIRGS